MLIRTQKNQQQLRRYAAGICGLMTIFIVTHWLRLILRNLLVRKVPGFTSSGHVLVVVAYVAINLSLTLTNVTMSISGIANRCGWMLCANFCLVVFLALKNTPLALLSAYSYERLNGLHQIAGYTTFVFLVLHASMYTNYFLSDNETKIFEGGSVRAGIVAGFGFLGVVFSATVVRHIWYEAFLVMHVVCFLIALISASYHQHELSSGLLVIFSVIAGLWGADRLVRGSRMLFGSINNHAVIEPLPDGGTKILLAKRPLGAVPGKHCFVWIPAIRKFESHPFTIAATEPMEFVVNAYDGFTRDLHSYAAANPGAKLMASVDGPYGTFPDPMSFDKVVLIAGGSGATFTFGLAVNMLERMGPDSTKTIVFIWAVKKHDNLSWFADHLQTLKTHPHSPKVNASLYVTAAAASDPSTQENSDAEEDRQQQHQKQQNAAPAIISSSSAIVKSDVSARPSAASTLSNSYVAADLEKAAATNRMLSTDSFHGHDLRPGRPDTATLIREAVSSARATDRVLVAACGPSGFMRTVRDTTASLIRGDGPGVELHCEQFGW
ncbi:hypothetical protein M406DRAFT_343011 [Cryphonectria parasitica EP155]|uniref:FAD-binding FR-type domain-containing protein n=1 Tax=Cryphonectria parasitica (strain ATCC 38755 / EP155) TaxID=660469 RepID=A0A9P4XU57_CRYP1|nr:uncharacterized protein M406DRAFT_343011 [Cryphonectria parasitica EP155]KAF3760842.1 hypothetical protein M406DRAFT_343011 [Cryphonectria parasitica EP155]